jgi:hypothetical protein
MFQDDGWTDLGNHEDIHVFDWTAKNERNYPIALKMKTTIRCPSKVRKRKKKKKKTKKSINRGKPNNYSSLSLEGHI